jgi:hypothetical protein
MTVSANVPRWAVSFADLGLLLLGCFVLLHAMEARRPTAAAGSASVAVARGEVLIADEYFEPGDARLTEAGKARLAVLADRLAGGGVEIVSRGVGAGGPRLDRFELGAARTAALARALRAGGVAEAGMQLRVENMAAGPAGQRITLTRH